LIALDGRYLQVNQAVSRITGYGAEHMHVRTLADVTHPDDLAADLAGMERLLTGEVDTYSLEKRYLTAGGDEIWDLNVGSPWPRRCIRTKRTHALALGC
jgi:PAS domain S-box-containing protein